MLLPDSFQNSFLLGMVIPTNYINDGNLPQWVYQNPDPDWVDEFYPYFGSSLMGPDGHTYSNTTPPKMNECPLKRD